ncbi:MAG: ribonuclease D [Candidatus Muproteobacteria bacterium RBG_16_62_13]|uniref:Ribonuclease D n=1 Tax=Candidatus Muproteobacteria bacterium RBG_16_62_13 TaxID=1817756 RepID=A0A1F6T7V1_9PROT|nr:MAG: ribonuclease D [Candidatus Muproteobacteria bacterium RBG_16_62_13]
MTELITTAAALADLSRRLKGVPWLALDTEFMRVDTYRARLCLVQLATDDLVVCVDVLAIDDLAPLFECLHDPATLKVLHAARQDLEVLYDQDGRVPAPLFDTQTAAALAGYPDQVGYGTLVEAECGERLAKAHTRADWSQRPLPEEMIRYAADDVIFLREVYRRLRDKLEKLGRLDWLREECAQQTDPARFRIDPELAYQRLGGSRLPLPAQTRLQALAAWRERTAIQHNRPRGWIVKDTALVEIARRNPVSIDELSTIADLPPAVVRRRGEELLAILHEANAQPPQRWYLDLPPLTSAEQAQLSRLSELVKVSAGRLGLPATLLATRTDLTALVRGARDGRVLQGWRASVIGEGLLGALAAPAA